MFQPLRLAISRIEEPSAPQAITEMVKVSLLHETELIDESIVEVAPVREFKVFHLLE